MLTKGIFWMISGSGLTVSDVHQLGEKKTKPNFPQLTENVPPFSDKKERSVECI